MDLAKKLGIRVTEIDDISSSFDDLKAPKGDWLVKNGEKAVLNVLNLIDNFDELKESQAESVVLKGYGMPESEFR